MIAILSVSASIFRWQINDVLIVNIIGCFLLGIINTFPFSRRYKLILGFGFCGSLTTFSGWTLHLFKLINEGLYIQFLLNSILFTVVGLFAVALGHLFAKKLLN